MKKIIIILLALFTSCKTTYESRKIDDNWYAFRVKGVRVDTIYKVPNYATGEGFMFYDIK